MGNQTVQLLKILNSYEAISNVRPHDLGALFELDYYTYLISITNPHGFPSVYSVFVKREYPHFSRAQLQGIDGYAYKICLYDDGTIVEYIHSFEEKVRASIEWLIALMRMTRPQIIEEYQKEFAVYWVKACYCIGAYSGRRYQLFLDDENSYQWLCQTRKKGAERVTRVAKEGHYFNDLTGEEISEKVPALYVPIEDARGIIPPLESKPWGKEEIIEIIEGVMYPHISYDAYQEIRTCSYTHRSLLFIFRIRGFYCGCIISFKNAGVAKLNVKIRTNIERVEPIYLERCDFSYLNYQIGNIPREEKVAIIGVGSLGSYVADEIAHAGFRNMILVDDDVFLPENVFRHRHKYIDGYRKKSATLSYEIGMLHPEMNVKAITGALTADTVLDFLREDVSIVIVTVGNSDIQIQLNQRFFELKVSTPVYYVWLEHDGKSSHVAAIRNHNDGCFECLFTNIDGSTCENTLNRSLEPVKYIRNGCGGTRVPYGNRTLLTASALVLQAISDSCETNRVYSYYDNAVHVNEFHQKVRCKCCGVQR